MRRSIARAPPLRGVDSHVWWISLQSPPEREDFALLDDSERSRAQRFHFERDRNRFVRAHAALRRVIASYLQCNPASLSIEAGYNGRPRIAHRPGESNPLDFNLSHSGGWAVLAVCAAGAVGVDVEAARDVPEWRALAQRHFTVSECARLDGLDEREGQAAFLRCWSRKEAALKTTGVGLARAGASDDGSTSRRVEVGIGPEPAECLVPDQHLQSVRLRVITLTAPQGTCAAWAGLPGVETEAWMLDG